MKESKRKLISIIFPSRGRLDLVEKLLLSIEENTYKKECIEVISIIDHDDIETQELFRKLQPKLTFDFYAISRKQNSSLNLPVDYYKLGIKLRSPSYFTWILGNDCEIITKNYDKLLYNGLMTAYKNIFEIIDKNQHYFYLRISDETHWNSEGKPINPKDGSCCFPMMSSNYCDEMNEMCPVELPSWGGDTCLYNLIKRAKNASIIDITSLVQIKHYTHHTKTYEHDEQAKRMENAYNADKIQIDGVVADGLLGKWNIIQARRSNFLIFEHAKP